MLDLFILLFGIALGLGLGVLLKQWQSPEIDSIHTRPLSALEQEPLLNSTNNGERATTPDIDRVAPTGLLERTFRAGWWSSRFYRPPLRPRASTLSISSPLHPPVVGDPQQYLQAMSRPPPLPILRDTDARWEEHARKRELAQSVLHHLSSEPPLGRHLRMAVRAALHLAEVSPEAVAIGKAFLSSWGVNGSDIGHSNSAEIDTKDESRPVPSLSAYRTTVKRRPALHLSNSAQPLNLMEESEENETPRISRAGLGLHIATGTQSRTESDLVQLTVPLDPEIPDINTTNSEHQDATFTAQTPSSYSTSEPTEQAFLNQWTVKLATTPLENEETDDTNVDTDTNQSVITLEYDTSIKTDSNKPAPKELAAPDNRGTSSTYGMQDIDNEYQDEDFDLQASFEAFQQRKRTRKRGDLLSALKDMEASETKLPKPEKLANDRKSNGEENESGEKVYLNNRPKSASLNAVSRPTSSIFDVDTSFYTPPETPSVTLKRRSTSPSHPNEDDELLFDNTASSTTTSDHSKEIAPSTTPVAGPSVTTTPSTTPRLRHHSSVQLHSRLLLEPPFFTAEQSHDWYIPGYGRIRFIDHCPQVFAELRRRFGFTLAEVDDALCESFERVSRTSGKSEAIFFATRQAQSPLQPRRKLLFKTLRGSEPENLRAFLPRYVDHVRRYPNTLLPRYLGMYTFERPSAVNASTSATAIQTTGAEPRPGQPIIMPNVDDAFPARMVLILMADVFDTPLTIHERYDFKGSTIGRHTLPLGTAGVTEDVTDMTLKEVDFRHRVSAGRAQNFSFGTHTKQKIARQLEIDTSLLREFEFMDYSLLIGVHKGRRKDLIRSQTTSQLRETPGPLSRSSTSRTEATDSGRHGTQRSRLFGFLAGILGPAFGMRPDAATTDPDLERQAPMPSFSSSCSADSEPSPTTIPWVEGISSQGLPNGEIYFIGLIDILQKYTFFKKLERGFKGANAHLRGTVDQAAVTVNDNKRDTPNTKTSEDDSRDNGSDVGTRSTSAASSTLMLLPLASWSSATAMADMFTIERGELSVEEPGRYAERLMNFVGKVIM